MSKPTRRVAAVAVGGAMLCGGILAVIFLPRPKAGEFAEPPIRPVKTVIVGEAVSGVVRRYPGTVQAANRVQLAFEVPGNITELPVVEGQFVTKNQVLAKLDPRDYQNTLNAKQAVEKRQEVNLTRLKELMTKGAAAPYELQDAEAAYDVAKADTAIAQKALDDTVLRATFDGNIAKTFVRQYQAVQAKQPILSLQDARSLEIVINVPEQVVAKLDKKGSYQMAASFDVLPGRQFPLTVKEFATEADPVTQTYSVTLSLSTPKDAIILPGMSGTVNVSPAPTTAPESEFYLPLSAVPSDGQGHFYVWVLKPAGEGLFRVHRREVEAGSMTGEYILVSGDIHAGEQVVAAGASLLVEGQRVRLLREPTTRPQP